MGTGISTALMGSGKIAEVIVELKKPKPDPKKIFDAINEAAKPGSHKSTTFAGSLSGRFL